MTAADRECQLYYQQWLAAHGSAVMVAQHLSSLADLQNEELGREPLSLRDETLIALAQNVVLRLNVDRCFVSLLDADHQYVLSESTRSCSSANPNGIPGDEVWIGSATLARPDALCERCLDSRCCANDAPDFVVDGVVVNDCRGDERFGSRPYVMQEEVPRVRFYAGVPLISRNGYKIGVLAITDDNPRNGLGAAELGCMQDMARCAMGHLEWARDRVDRFKGERVVRAMAAFIDEASTLHDNSASNTSNQRRPSLRRNRSWRHVKHEATRDDSGGVFPLAANILRDSVLADGCVIFGARADTDLVRPDQHAGPPSDRLCKMLALSVADGSAGNPIATGRASPITIGDLHRYFKAAPRGCAFTFNQDALAVHSEQETQDEFKNPTKPSTGTVHSAESRLLTDELDHSQLLERLPGACNIIFLPLKHLAEDRLVAGIFLWTSTLGRIPDTDLSHVRAFANCIASEIMRAELQRDETAKTTFMASMSHELRSPLHGILGSAEFLIETTANAYEAGLVSSILTCGKTLLDTLNHVLDYSKINKLKGLQGQQAKMERQHRPLPATASPSDDGSHDLVLVDLGALVEEVADAVVAAHTFSSISSFSSSTASVPLGRGEHSFDSLSAQRDESGGDEVENKNRDSSESSSSFGVAVLLDISPRDSWTVHLPQGSLQRIVMNLFGNALKFTSSGFVGLSLRTLETAEDDDMLPVLIRVVDSGKGIGDAFLQNSLFVPFSQEDPFQPGTGLGLSIVKQLVDSLGGSVEVRSTPNVGTEVDVLLKLAAVESPVDAYDEAAALPHPLNSNQPSEMHRHPLAMAAKMAGKKLVLLDPLDPNMTRTPTHQASRFQQAIRETCERWFSMTVSRATHMSPDDDVDIYLYGEPPPMELLRHHKREYRQKAVPVILACQNGHDAIKVIRNQQKFLREVGEIVEVLQEPCGPRKLAKTLMHCLNRAEEVNRQDAGAFEAIVSPPSEEIGDQVRPPATSKHQPTLAHRPGSPLRRITTTTGQELRKSVSAAVALPSTPTLDPETPDLRSDQGRDTSLDLLAPVDGSVPPRPEAQDSTSSHQPLSPPSPTTSPKPPHVLIVDDNKINRQLLVTFMKKNAFTYQQAENGQEAVDLFTTSLSTSPFDYILMDISMPVMDGLEATRRIREEERQSRRKVTKIFALTGLASEKAREEAEMAGVDLFLAKPVKFKALKELLI